MAKAPIPGLVKTRLRPFLTDSQSAELAECFLVDTVAKDYGTDVGVWIAYTPDSGLTAIADRISGPYFYIKQIGDDLGERLSNVFDKGFSNGFAPIVVIGTDSPTLPAGYVKMGMDFLSDDPHGVVLGPTDDGGYYLIGLSSARPTIFQNINWSSERVYDQTLSNLGLMPVSNLFGLPRWFDVDTPDDLLRLFTEMEHDHNLKGIAPKTAQWLDCYRELFNRSTEPSVDLSFRIG